MIFSLHTIRVLSVVELAREREWRECVDRTCEADGQADGNLAINAGPRDFGMHWPRQRRAESAVPPTTAG